MSIYAIVDGSEPAFFSSNTGWSEIIAWADGLDAKEFEAVVALTEHGATEDIKELREQMASATTSNPPDESVGKTIAELMDLIDDETESVFITNGESDAT
jgi:hypothetical protein